MEKIEPLEKLLEKKLICEIIHVEGVKAIGVKPLWNHQGCTYGEICLLRKSKKEKNPKSCSYNPKMFKCPAYQFYAIGEDR